jgi:hypothetical protein
MDVGSAVVTPGLVIPHSDLKWAKDIDETVDADASYLRAIDVFDPNEGKIRRLAQDGFLGLAYAPGSANVLAGSVGLVRPGAAEPVRTDFLAGKFVLTADSRNAERYPASLAGQYELIDQALSAKPLERQLFVPELIQDQLEHERKRHLEALLSRQKVAMIAARTESALQAACRLSRSRKLRTVPVRFETPGRRHHRTADSTERLRPIRRKPGEGIAGWDSPRVWTGVGRPDSSQHGAGGQRRYDARSGAAGVDAGSRSDDGHAGRDRSYRNGDSGRPGRLERFAT